MDTTLSTGDAGNEKERTDEREGGDEWEWRHELKKARKALAEARRREEELEGVLREGERAMGELEEWIARKVGAMSLLAADLLEEWLKEAVLSRVDGARKRACMADGAPSHPMMMMENLAALSAHAEAIRSMVQGVRRLAFEVRTAHADRMQEEKEGRGEKPWEKENEEGGEVREEGVGDVRGVDVRGADVRGADVRGADVRGADVRGADVRGADVRGADPLISAAHSAGSSGGAGVDSEGAVTTNVKERHAHRGGGGVRAGRAGGTQVKTAQQWPPVGGRASEAEVRARLRRRIDSLLRIRPERLQLATLRINWVVSQLLTQDPAEKELSLDRLSLAYYLHLTPHCYPDFLPSLTTLAFRIVDPLSPFAVKQLLSLPSLTALHFHETSIQSDTVPFFQCMSRLQRLVIACVEPFDLLPNVPAANLPPPSNPPTELRPFKPFESLRELHVSRVTDSILQQVGVLTSLEVFSCTCSKGVSSRGWMHLKGLHLEVHAVDPSSTAVRSVSNLRQLKTLRITGTLLDDSDVVCLRRLSLLTDLSLAACTFAADRAVRSVIQGMAHLQSLHLSGTAISQGAVHLQALERLERLKLQQCSGMSRLFVQHLSCVPALRELDLGCNNMQHAWLLPVLEGKKVTRLRVGGCGFVERTLCEFSRAWIEIDSEWDDD
ncbi:unnamed protein product [Closterium sp. NIES-65]|nr:unnamed protein product [Closterium sp. NIES-65]